MGRNLCSSIYILTPPTPTLWQGGWQHFLRKKNATYHCCLWALCKKPLGLLVSTRNSRIFSMFPLKIRREHWRLGKEKRWAYYNIFYTETQNRIKVIRVSSLLSLHQKDKVYDHFLRSTVMWMETVFITWRKQINQYFTSQREKGMEKEGPEYSLGPSPVSSCMKTEDSTAASICVRIFRTLKSKAVLHHYLNNNLLHAHFSFSVPSCCFFND